MIETVVTMRLGQIAQHLFSDLRDVSFDVLHVLMVRDRHDFLGRAEHWRLGQVA